MTMLAKMSTAPRKKMFSAVNVITLNQLCDILYILALIEARLKDRLVLEITEAQQLQPARDALEADFKFVVQDVAAHHCLNGELINRSFDKGRGVRIVAQACGIPIEDTIGFGDSMNDLEMIETVGTSVCMDNGSPKLKEVSDIVCPAVDADGLAIAFSQLGLI